MSRGRSADRGSATLLAAVFVCLLLLVGAALGVVASVFLKHRQAQAAADLAALAGAGALAGTSDPCEAAASTAAANGGLLIHCRVVGRDVTVQVEVAGPRWLGFTGDLSAEARAGPASVSPDAPLPHGARQPPASR